MLPSSAARILESLSDTDVVLDAGGGYDPFPRADWVIDIVDYSQRRQVAAERFSEATWINRDLCDRAPLPFADKQIDFAICSHTLEDIRDPIWVCAELSRVARAGYVEVPSRLEEQSRAVHGPWTGWSHHHWLIDLVDGGLEFVFKSAVVHTREAAHFPAGTAQRLTPEQKVLRLWWTDELRASERIFLGPGGIDDYLADFVTRHGPEVGPAPRPATPIGRLKRALGG